MNYLKKIVYKSKLCQQSCVDNLAPLTVDNQGTVVSLNIVLCLPVHTLQQRHTTQQQVHTAELFHGKTVHVRRKFKVDQAVHAINQQSTL